MKSRKLAVAVAVISVATAGSALAEPLKSSVAFNTGIGQKTEKQPENGIEVAYQVTLSGGELDGCTADIVEQLYGHEEGAWGTFYISGDVNCASGGFAFTSAGAWDGNGFHGAGSIVDGSGTGDFTGITGRIAQLAGGGAATGDGTMDISYDLVVDASQS